ncbi:MAG: PTS sugar transporter subunit IIA [Deltaproteobacteria bacterium]|nr:PTS sugar transporter subunit IIA [Deltaproteobacteria bacterium]
MSDLSVRDAAELLKVSEKTIYRWIRQGVIPTYRFQGQYRFNQDELKDWASYKRIGASSEGIHQAGPDEVNLYRAVLRGGIHYKLEGSTSREVIAQAVQLFPLRTGSPSSLKEALLQTLLEREELVSTGIGSGIAIPHPRHPRDWGLGEPAVGIFFLDNQIDFQAVDGQPVHVLFMLLCDNVKGHLKLLSQVSHLVNNKEMQSMLRSAPKRSDLLEKIADAFPEQTGS